MGCASCRAQEAAGARGVDHEAGAELERLSVARPAEAQPVAVEFCSGEQRAIAVVDAGRDRLPDEVVVDVGAQPVRVRDLVVRARRDQQPLGVETAIGERACPDGAGRT